MFNRAIAEIAETLSTQYPVVTLLGPRQSGKSTLVKSLFKDMKYVNLEAPDERKLIESDPRSFLESIPKEGIIIDEVQRLPELLSYIQVYVDDNPKRNRQFILTGSHQLALHEAISQSLAGRTTILRLLPFSIAELRAYNIEMEAEDYILKGLFPKLYNQEMDHTKYYQDYVSTYLERDVRRMINVKDLSLFQDFLQLAAGRIGQLVNYNSLSNDLGVSNHTVKQWFSILEASYVTVKIKPYFENISKRVVKSPKIYFTDPGLACYLLGIENQLQLKRDPLRGNLFENMVILELIKSRYNLGKEHNLSFYRDNHKNEVDILYKSARQIIPIEIKSSKTFHTDFLKGLRYFDTLMTDRVPHGYVIFAGSKTGKVDKFNIINFLDSGKSILEE